MADKYRLQLTGEQVDDALRQLNERVAEGWAVGEKNGQAVSPSSPYYNNNARHYAEQAASSASMARSAVLWDRVQTLTDDQKSQARANITAATSNPNLLLNPFFDINQREIAESEDQFSPFPNPISQFVDRWEVYGSNTSQYKYKRGVGITLKNTSASRVECGISQRIEQDLVKAITGRIITLSVIADGEIVSGTVRYSGSGSTLVFSKSYGSNKSIKGYILSSGLVSIAYTVKGLDSEAGTIKAAKLEVGGNSTIENDISPDYMDELAKCQRYFRRIKSGGVIAIGIAYGETGCRVPLPFGMRGTPRIARSGSITLKAAGQEYVVAGIERESSSSSSICIMITASGLSPGNAYGLYLGEDAYIDFSV